MQNRVLLLAGFLSLALASLFLAPRAHACPWLPYHAVSTPGTLPGRNAQVSSVARHPGLVEMFAVGNDGRVYERWQNDDGQPTGAEATDSLAWVPISTPGTGIPGAKVTAISRRPEQIELFVVGNDGKIYTRAWLDYLPGPQWFAANAWYPISTPDTASKTSAVAAVSRFTAQVDLFVVGTDGKIYTQWWNDDNHTTWYDQGPWMPISPAWTASTHTTVAALSRRPEQIDLFVVGTDGRIWTQWWNDNDHRTWYSQEGWAAISTRNTASTWGSVAAISRRPSQMELFVVGTNGVVYEQWWNDGAGTGWFDAGPWVPISAPLTSNAAAITAVSRRPERLELFVVGSQGAVLTQWWEDSQSSTHEWFQRLPWISLGGVFPVGAVVNPLARGSSRVDLFIGGLDGTVWQTTWTDPTTFYPHYVLATLIYAPPGKASHADYTFGSSTGSRTEVVETRGAGADVKVETTGTEFEDKWVVQTKDGRSQSFTKSSSNGISLVSGADAIDHDGDTFYLWLNPALEVCANGYEAHQKWSVANGELANVVEVSAGELSGRRSMPSWKIAALANLTDGEKQSLLGLDPFLSPQFSGLDPARFAYVDTMPVDGPAWDGGTSSGYTKAIGYDQSTGTIKGTKDGNETVALAGGQVVFGIQFGVKGGLVYDYEYEKTTEMTTDKQQTMAVTFQTDTVGYHAVYDIYYDAAFGTYAFVPSGRRVGDVLPPVGE